MDFDYLHFMRRDCYLLAEVLHNLTGLPLVGIWSGGDLHHVGVYDEAADVYVDRRGESSMEEFVGGCAGNEVRPATMEDLEATGASYSDEEYTYAEEWAWDNLGDILSNYQQ